MMFSGRVGQGGLSPSERRRFGGLGDVKNHLFSGMIKIVIQLGFWDQLVSDRLMVCLNLFH